LVGSINSLEMIFDFIFVKRLLLPFCLLPIVLQSAAGEERYYRNDDVLIYIDSTHLTVFRQYVDSLDTLAHCTYQRMEDGFIEVSTILSDKLIYESIDIMQSYDANLRDSVRYEIDFACSTMKYQLLWEFQWREYQRDFYSNTQKSYTFKEDDFRYCEYITIIPENWEESFNVQNGSLCPFDFDISLFDDSWKRLLIKPNNVMHISIPLLTDNYFHRLQLKGEYMRMTDDAIVWRGMNFVRDNITLTK